jgi:MinD-like ATPase involved in chromosome partitioning or flagellar assembly
LGEKVTGYVQSDYNTAVNSINLGEPLVKSNPASRIAQEIRQIAASITGATLETEIKEPRKGVWGSIFGRQAGAISNAGLRSRLNKDNATAAI